MFDLTPGDDVPVVNLDKQAEAAYRMGYGEFAGFDTGLADERDEDTPPVDLSHFKSGAKWANTINPDLRCMAGNADPTGKGTWTESRPVVVLRDHEVDDEPAPGSLVDSAHLVDVLIDWWDRGAYDASEGDDMDPATDEITAV